MKQSFGALETLFMSSVKEDEGAIKKDVCDVEKGANKEDDCELGRVPKRSRSSFGLLERATSPPFARKGELHSFQTARTEPPSHSIASSVDPPSPIVIERSSEQIRNELQRFARYQQRMADRKFHAARMQEIAKYNRLRVG